MKRTIEFAVLALAFPFIAIGFVGAFAVSSIHAGVRVFAETINSL
jgi:hypothetical protein